ncbi:PP2C family protein-serine/threonine phosphatase [Streptomyces sp. NPDC052040]|uniref:PP2C family protein-serine/threonine phosphatase n=1 Tax=Streptomyces sp. NPDC052040 TaxID=3365682 RepID=UPI0037D5FA45
MILMFHHIVGIWPAARRVRCPAATTGPTRKGTTLRKQARSRTDVSPAAAPSGRRSAFSPAAEVIGSELDLHLTSRHIAQALTPGFCDAASVYLLERWLVEENAYAAGDPPQIEARRLALRVGTEAPAPWEGILPLGEVIVFPRETPYARALATRAPQLLDEVDAHTSERLRALGDDARIVRLLRTASFLVVPLHLRGAAVGFIVCGRGPDRARFLPDDATDVEALAARACVALDNARRYERERRTALAIRQSLLPGTAHKPDGCHIAHGYVPAGHDTIIGGDWFDVLPRPGGRIGLVVGDAMGHGPESAVAMIQLRTAARTLAGIDITPADLMRRLDALACDTPGASFATCVYAEWDAQERICTLVGAGHPPPLMRSPDGRAAPVTLASPGLPLGLGTGAYEPTVLPVPEPALLLLYSDGMVESRHSDIDEGIARLARLLAGTVDAHADVTAPDALHTWCERLLHDASVTDGPDDRTVLLASLIPSKIPSKD